MGSLIKKYLRTTKGKITAGAIGLVLIAAVVITIIVIVKSNGYRTVAVEDFMGNVIVIGDKNNGQAYKGQHLYDGDDVSVGKYSELTLCMDNEKYVYADENTHFVLVNSSTRDNSRLKIVLDEGSELNVLSAKLGAGDSYEVDTPNSTMAVRGTRFRPTV